ncbi:MAG: OmpW family outer membrane protein [Syntrophotaleaceae bacterium]
MNRKQIVLVGALCAAVFALSLVSNAMAAEDFERWSVSTQIMYLDVDLDAELLDVSSEDAMTGGLVVEYFFTPNISAELVAAVAHLDLEVRGVTDGETWVLPPSIYAKYHFMPQAKISPYVGVGLNWMYFWDTNTDATDLHIDNSFGWNAKVGADIQLFDNVYANVDIMYLNNETEFDTGLPGVRNLDLDVEVWSYNVGLKYRF